MGDIRNLLSVKERWNRDMRAAMPQWVNDIKPCRVAKTGVGAQLSFVCRCTVTPDKPHGKTVQVPVRTAVASGHHTIVRKSGADVKNHARVEA